MKDMEIFYAATQIKIGNSYETPFWEAPLLHGRKPKDIVALIFTISKIKTWKVNQTMEDILN
jgi:hypothetical protein